MSTLPLPSIALDLRHLRSLLLQLPDTCHSSGDTYPFQDFVLDDEWVDLTGSAQGSVNHSLEVAFGSRSNAAGEPIKFKSHGADLAAVVDVLSTYITGEDGENPILINWIADLKVAAIDVYSLAQTALPDLNEPKASKRVPKLTTKRSTMLREAEEQQEQKRQKVETKAATEKAKSRTEGTSQFNFDPANLREIPATTHKAGRKPSALLDRLSVLCEVISDPSKKRWRCSGPSCPQSWSHPRMSSRITAHAMECSHLDPELAQEAAGDCSLKSLGAQVAAMSVKTKTEGSLPGTPGTQPSVEDVAKSEGREQRSIKYNHNALNVVCGLSLPPTILDSTYWKKMLDDLDPKIDRYSSSHIASTMIPAEAALVREKSLEVLRSHRHLTLSFDGATTRRNQSIYTVHFTTPNTRQAHLIAGSSASGKSHTGEHLKQAIKLVGVDRLAGISSDSTGNTRLARELVAKEYPWVILLPDPCHQMNNTAKDLGNLLVFDDTNKKLKIVVRFFRKSSYAGHHLTALRIIEGVMKGIIGNSKTRFLTLFYAIEALLPSLPLILELIKTGVIEVKPNHALYWMRDKQLYRSFEDHLRQEKALLEPFARSVKCLESSASTPADVALFWLASLASLDDLFTDTEKRNELMLTNQTISEVYACVNGRFTQMIDGPDRGMYIATLFLDFKYVQSSLFTRKSINPLALTVSIPGRADPATHDTPDSDLRRTLPVYTRVGDYLGSVLVAEINSGRGGKVFAPYSTADEIEQEFRFQFMNYARNSSPFDRYQDSATAHAYWKKLLRHIDACILAYIAIKLFSIVPNSMAEERTVSNFTQLNTACRSRQNTRTLVQMTQIKQHHQRAKNELQSVVAPTVRFRDLSDILKKAETAPATEPPKGESVSHDSEVVEIPASELAEAAESELELDAMDEWEESAGLAGENVMPPAGSTEDFEVAEADGINLHNPALLDLLSETPIPGASWKITTAANKPSRFRPSGSQVHKLTAKPFKF
ncbi:hypothetical protein BDV93DRAFT_607815 [Ceratobasidium sp. AG-I]|nr:hypothetical protein BDV93DRAFT_607815 [Ceratobasidium sp. AG-I]